MRILDILTEAREAPLYHFTSGGKLFNILRTDTLISPSGKIYFTRDIDRQFLPHEGQLLKDITWGLRIDQGRLYQKYGKRLRAGGQPTGWTKEKRDAWMADPANADEIEQAKTNRQGSGRIYSGAMAADIVRGTVGRAQRWESEEHLYVSKLENLHEYLTGLVVGGGFEQYTKGRSKNPLGELVEIFINRYGRKENWAKRDALMKYAKHFNIPFVFKRTDIPAEELEQAIITTQKQRKIEREREANKSQMMFLIYKNEQKGGISASASSLAKAVEKIRNKIGMVYGYQNIDTGEEKMFDPPVPAEQLINKTSAQ